MNEGPRSAGCYLALREAQGADGHRLLVQLNLLNDQHPLTIVHSLHDIAVVYRKTTE